MALKVSPLAPTQTTKLPAINGARMAAVQAGIRYKDRIDLMMMELAEGTTIAGVTTQSLTASAPVEWCRECVKHGKARALVVNAGNSNAFTGKAGIASVDRVVKAVASLLKCDERDVSMASTGVIGEPLPDNKITAHLPTLQSSLKIDGWDDAARAIMTTDTFPKSATRTVKIGNAQVTLNGIAKGSGMIAPDMATMLAFLVTDAAIPAPVLQALLAEANDKTFNCITVDSDTSTSDTGLLFATGKADNALPTSASDPALKEFKTALYEVLLELAHMIVKDGEGASKFVTITITGADSGAAAKRIGLSIANSPLVKTAIAGEDANWGRIVMAVGKAGEKADRDKLQITIGGTQVTRDGMVVPGYDETPVVAHVKGQDVKIEVDVGVGKGTATVWTCDLTHGYIDINGSYRS